MTGLGMTDSEKAQARFRTFPRCSTFFWQSDSDNDIVRGMVFYSTKQARPPSRGRYGATRCCAQLGRPVESQCSMTTESRFRNRAHRARLQRRGTKAAPNMCFCETNPPFFDGIFVVSDYGYMCCARNERRKSVGSFSETNLIRGPKVSVFAENEPKMRGKMEWKTYAQAMCTVGRPAHNQGSVLEGSLWVDWLHSAGACAGTATERRPSRTLNHRREEQTGYSRAQRPPREGCAVSKSSARLVKLGLRPTTGICTSDSDRISQARPSEIC